MTPSAVKLSSTDGAELLGAFVSVALWGTTCMQTLIYFIQYPKDQLGLKALVVWLWLADTVHGILIVKGAWDSLIIGFCNYDRIKTAVPEYMWQLLCTTLISITSQVFFTFRIWKFNGRKLFYWIILVPICLFELGGGLAFLAFGIMVPTAAELTSPVPSGIFIALLAVAAATDLLIAARLVVLLIQSRERALRGARSVVDKFLILTINTGIWTALFGVSTFVAFIAFRSMFVYAALYFPLCPLYCNTVLANLNAREFLMARSLRPDTTVMDNSLNIEPIFSTCAQGPIGTQSMGSSLTVQVRVNKSMDRDEAPSLRTRGTKLESEALRE